ncbi:MAG: hypothetical protein L6R35_001987 [Caloplaca aegaea]|nr:MAG: hypothetical protein L6R35_001987 [Caloplaca aegaea]
MPESQISPDVRLYVTIAVLYIVTAVFRTLANGLWFDTMITVDWMKLELNSLITTLSNVAVSEFLMTLLPKFGIFKANRVRLLMKHADSSDTMNPSNGDDRVTERMLQAQQRLEEHIESQWAEFCDYLQNPSEVPLIRFYGDNSEAFERRISHYLQNLEVLQKLHSRLIALEEEDEDEYA